MDELPRKYSSYLADLTDSARGALTPVFRQSVADGEHGIKVWILGHEMQASVSDDVPFGDIVELHE